MKILITLFALLSFNAQAINCPAGTKKIDSTCKLIVNNKSQKTQMVKKLFAEGEGGETHRAVVAYAEKLLGKNAAKNIKDITPPPQQPTQNWFGSLWLKITGNSQKSQTSEQDKSHMKKAWKSIFQADK